MLSYSEAFYKLSAALRPLYDEREAAAIAHEVMGHITALNKMQRLMDKEARLTASQQREYDDAAKELAAGTPLQYVTGTAWFLGREFHVNNHVLIPRPETEELVQWIVDDNKGRAQPLTILDIGTGSGCIPVSLKLSLPSASVAACDVSANALAVARENANRLAAEVSFMQADFLETAEHNKFGTYDVIVSNPPYIPLTEKEQLHANVRNHEPHIALFVPAEDALLFYKMIAVFGKAHLADNGYIYCELDAAHAFECKTLFEETGYKQAELRKDMHGNWRMLKASKR